MLARFNDMSDEELVRLSQNGDTEAEETLIRRYHDSIKGKAHVYFIVGADSEDVIQEGMIGLYKAIRSFKENEGTSFKTYANVCIDRQIISAIRTADRLKHQPLNESISLSTPVGEDEGTLEESLAQDDSNPETESVLNDLAEILSGNGEKIFSRMEYAVLQGLMEGKTYQQIGEALDKDYKSIDNAIQRIKKKIYGYIFS